jgi:hypothetical protein
MVPVCHLEDLLFMVDSCAVQKDAMASPDHIAKRRRLNSPPSEQGEPDDEYVCYGMVRSTLLLVSIPYFVNHTF